MDGFSNPASASSEMNSCSSSAPATQPIQSSTLRRMFSGTAPRTTTSEIANRPPGLSTRNASRITRRLSPERFTTQFEMITSTELSGSGMFSISPFRNSTLVAPALRLFSFASASISSVISRPYALPVGPTRLAESRTSMPPPEPRSSTTSPSLSAASMVGLPQPSDASSASAGIPAVWPASYMSDVIGSQDSVVEPQHPLEPHAEIAVFPSATRVAAAPYLSRTTSRRASPVFSVIGLLSVGTRMVDVSDQKKSVAALDRPCRGALGALERREQRFDLVECLAIERVVDPAALATIRHEIGVLERLEVERQPALRCVHEVGQLADTAFAANKPLDDLQARLVGERVEPAGGLGGVE